MAIPSREEEMQRNRREAWTNLEHQKKAFPFFQDHDDVL
jgi:hypothetical protein